MSTAEETRVSRDMLDDVWRAGFRRSQDLGYHVQPNDFYTPLNDCAFLEQNPDLWANTPTPEGIDWRLERQMAVAREVGGFVDELRDIPSAFTRTGEFCWNNGFWNNSDALVQYGLVRSRQPRQYVEIGCGWSSLLLARALGRNDTPCAVDLVEPYGNDALLDTLPATWTRHRTILQRAPFDLFDRLGPGDVLFYDGSHCSKAASDVNWFFFRILPRLASGVLVHLHDIFLPDEYPKDWIFERGQTWNEQYILQAFLMHNSAYGIEMANRYLFRQRWQELEQIYKGVQPSWGCSFWFVKL